MSAPSKVPNRPLSPFMLGPYYKFQLTSVLSFAHRVTGLGLSMGTLLVAAWLIALASGPWTYADFSAHLTAWYGQALLAAWSWALLYHLCNGVRHLFWDIGKGYSLPVAYASGYAVVAVSFLLTGAVWALAHFV